MGKKIKKVCMFVLNPCTNDARVLKEAETLGKAGYDVKIIAIVSKDAPDLIEKRGNFTIYRVHPRSLFVHFYIIINKSKNVLKHLHLPIRTVLKIILQHCKDLLFAGSKQNKLNETKDIRKRKSRIPNILQDTFLKFHKINVYSSYWIKARNLAVSLQADTYHAHDLNTLLPAYLASRKTGTKVIYDAHELYTDRNTLCKKTELYKFVIRRAESFLIKKVDAVITVNESIAVELSNLYNIRVPFVIMNCPNYRLGTRNNLLREKIGLNGNQQVILYLGAITFNRGLEESIMAMQKVNNGVLAVMGYGKPEYISVLKDGISRSGVEEKVYFIPPVPPHEVVKYAASADIGIVPIQNACKSYYYCSPNKLFESMMAGLPVAASNFPEMRRIIQETNTGCLFNSSNPDDIANVLNNMLSDGKAIEQMRNNALQHAHKYSWEEESKKLLSTYAGLFA